MNEPANFRNYDAPADLLKDKTIVISGAGAGIGRAAALAFAKHGATVILLGRTMSKLEKVYDEIEAQGGPTPAIFPINFQDAATKDYSDLRAILETEFGHIDGLLNNACELGPRTSIASYAPAAWSELMQVNVTAPFLLTQSMLPLLQKAPTASILFTGSDVGLQGKAYWGGYAASNAACENLMQTLADELENTSKIRANSINPGPIRTAMRELAYPGENPATVTEPAAIMNRYLYLISDASIGLNGQQLQAQ